MFSKLSAFRNRATPSKDGKPNGQANRRLSTADEDQNLNSNSFYYGLMSPVSVKSSYETSSIQDDFLSSHLLPYEDAEEQFLEEQEGYFAHLSVDNVRQDQYPKLELQRLVYLDYATSPLYSRYQVDMHMQFLLEEAGPWVSLCSNTENSPLQQQKMNYIKTASNLLLNLLNTTQEDYTVIFTPGLSSACRLFAKAHPFQKGSVLLVSEDGHDCARLIVDAAQQSGVKTLSLPLRHPDWSIHSSGMRRILQRRGWSALGCGILVSPAQSHFSGMRYSLNWIVEAQQNGWKVLLDVTSSLPMIDVDLSLYRPEFVISSSHSILGYPSDVGFLLVRRDSHSVCSVKGSSQVRIAEAPEHGRFVHTVTEDDSLAVHTFAALTFGLKHLESIGNLSVQMRVESIVSWLLWTLKSLKHKLDQKPLVQVYGSPHAKDRGSIIAFNVLDSTGNAFPAGLVRRLAERSNIFLGIARVNSSELAAALLKGKYQRESISKVAVRLSLGPVSTFKDVYKVAQFLSRFRDEDYSTLEATDYVEERTEEC